MLKNRRNMPASNVSGQLETRSRIRFLKPLIIPLLVILALFGIRTHERLARKTFLAFQVTLESRPVSYDAFCDGIAFRSEEHTSELQSPCNLVCRLLLEKKKNRAS